MWAKTAPFSKKDSIEMESKGTKKYVSMVHSIWVTQSLEKWNFINKMFLLIGVYKTLIWYSLHHRNVFEKS